MLSTSILSEGLNGMQQSQAKMAKAAEDIVRAGQSADSSGQNLGGSGSVPQSTAGAAINDLAQSQSVSETERPGQIRVEDALIEQKRQAQLFDASANVVKVANDTLGQLIDDIS